MSSRTILIEAARSEHHRDGWDIFVNGQHATTWINEKTPLPVRAHHPFESAVMTAAAGHAMLAVKEAQQQEMLAGLLEALAAKEL
jgi:hypothetical protein